MSKKAWFFTYKYQQIFTFWIYWLKSFCSETFFCKANWSAGFNRLRIYSCWYTCVIHVCIVNTLLVPTSDKACLFLSRRCLWRTSTLRSEPSRTWRISWAGLCWCWTYRRLASPKSLRPWSRNYWRRRRCLPRPLWRRPAMPSSPRIPVRITPQTAGDNFYTIYNSQL